MISFFLKLSSMQSLESANLVMHKWTHYIYHRWSPAVTQCWDLYGNTVAIKG